MGGVPAARPKPGPNDFCMGSVRWAPRPLRSRRLTGFALPVGKRSGNCVLADFGVLCDRDG